MSGSTGVVAAARMEEGHGSNTGSPVGGVARANQNRARGRQGGGGACSTAEAGRRRWREGALVRE
ncbi:MAG: hypothetical protein OXF33_11295 [Rhodospirillales bacterium]|nr:hypothetical protein [Rhodospirillales bacterium]